MSTQESSHPEAAAHCDIRYLNYKQIMEGKLIQNGEHSVINGVDQPTGPNTMGIALFGLGRIGTIHLENLLSNPEVKILYCVEGSTERAMFIRNMWRMYDTEFVHPSDNQKVFEDSRVSAVVICTPTTSHESLILKSIGAGKAVLCEKPLAFSDEGIKSCYQAAQEAEMPLLCAFNRRFDPGLQSIKQRVDKGEVGKVHVVKTCSRDCPLPTIEYLKTSGGIFHDTGVHDIDIICWVVGEYPVSVTAQAHAFLPEIKEIGDYDTIAITMKFPSGTLGVIDISRNAIYGYDQRLEVFGSNGMLTCADIRPTAVQKHTTIGSTAVPICFSFASRYHESYIAEVNHFIDVVEGRAKVGVSATDTLASSRIATACETAAKTNQTVFLDWEKN